MNPYPGGIHEGFFHQPARAGDLVSNLVISHIPVNDVVKSSSPVAGSAIIHRKYNETVLRQHLVKIRGPGFFDRGATGPAIKVDNSRILPGGIEACRQGQLVLEFNTIRRLDHAEFARPVIGPVRSVGMVRIQGIFSDIGKQFPVPVTNGAVRRPVRRLSVVHKKGTIRGH